MGGVGIGASGVAGEDEVAEDRAISRGGVGGTELGPKEELGVRVSARGRRRWN